MWLSPLSRVSEDDWYNGPWKTSYGLYTFGRFGGGKNLTTLGADFVISGQRKDVWNKGVADIAPYAWSYLAVTYDGTELLGYVNGVLDFAVPAPGTLDDSSLIDLTMGSFKEANSAPIHGLLDEVRISQTARSGDWISTCYNNQSSPDTFYTIDSEVQQ
jgi:hypothetical protein